MKDRLIAASLCALLTLPALYAKEPEPAVGSSAKAKPKTLCGKFLSKVTFDRAIMAGTLTVSIGAFFLLFGISKKNQNLYQTIRDLQALQQPLNPTNHPEPLLIVSGVPVFRDFEAAPYRNRLLNDRVVSRVQSHLKSLGSDEVQSWGLEIIETGLNKYPDDALAGLVHAIYLVGSARREDLGTGNEVHLGGFASGSGAFIVLNLNHGFMLSEDVEGALHHEVGELILSRGLNPFQKEALAKEWQETLPKEFHYFKDNYTRASNRAWTDQYRSSFVSNYSQKSWTEDFCETFAEMMRLGSDFWTAYAKKPEVLDKAELVLATLEKIDVRLNRKLIDGLTPFDGPEPMISELFDFPEGARAQKKND